VTGKRKPVRRAGNSLQQLQDRLDTAEETLRALRAGDVDALVVAGAGGAQVQTLAGADIAYIVLFDQMNEGAVTLTRDGVIAYANRRFAEIVRTDLPNVLGAPLRRFVAPDAREAYDVLRETGNRASARADLSFVAGDGSPLRAAVSLAPLRPDGTTDVIGVVGVIRDITERQRQDLLRDRLIAQVMTAQDEERRRIARELHDETGQSLTALLVGLRSIEDAESLVQAVDLARRLRETAARTLVDVGRLSRGLHPSALDDLGLAAAIASYAQNFSQMHGIDVDLEAEGLEEFGLSPILETTLFRVVQEALTNVVKHAGARSVRVTVLRDDQTVLLRIQDDGVGFDLTASPASPAGDRRRLGLQGMRERAALLGGSVSVETSPGTGTLIAAYFPVPGARAL
jgi:PAS domain S-box-containing protein